MIGEPLMGTNRRPQQCHQKSLCPEEYFCHIGYNDSTTVCCPSIGDPCVLPLNEGNGEQKMTRWYYNQSQRQCQQFTYKGICFIITCSALQLPAILFTMLQFWAITSTSSP